MIEWSPSDVLDILNGLGLTNHPKSRPSNSNIFICCPFHPDKTPSLSVSLSQGKAGLWQCWGCNEKGTFAQFIKKHLGEEEGKSLIRKYHAPSEGRNYHFRPLVIPKDKVYEVIKYVEVVDELELEQYDDPFHSYAQRRGISKEICEKFRLGYDDKYPQDPSITFPVKKDGKYICVCRRKIKKDPDSKYPAWDIPKGLLKPVCYLDEAVEWVKADPSRPKRVVVCEAFFDALSCWTKGIPAVALLGNPQDQQEGVLVLNDEIIEYVLAFDGDTVGQRYYEQFKNVFKDKKLVRVVDMPIGKDINDLLLDGTFDEIVGKVYWN